MTDSLYENRHGWHWPKADVGAWAAVFFTLGDLDAAIRLCKNRDTVVQAGGNCGVWPKHLASQFRRVLTFEADPINYGALVKNVTETNVMRYNAALGEHYGQSVIISEYNDTQNFGARFVMPGEVSCDDPRSTATTMTVDQLRLTALDLLVLDVEGYETPALRGAVDSILRFRPVIMFEDKHAERYGFQKPEEYLTTLNYRVADRRHRDVIMVPAL
jgi:FkbM family methyltransferase